MGKALIIIIVGFTTIFTGIIFNASSTQQIIASDMNDLHEQWIAKNNAESINNVIQSKIYQGTAAVTDTFYLDESKGYFSAAVVPNDSVNEAVQILVRAFTEFNDQQDSTFTLFMLPAYSYYQYFVNHWHTGVTHSTGDTTWGPLHSNQQIDVSGAPVYMSKVSSAISNGFSAATAVARGGTEFGITAIPPPDIVPLGTVITNLPGKIFAVETWINFLPSGNFQHGPDPTYGNTEALTAYSGLIMSTGGNDLHVSGVVNGRVTVLSGNDIFIEDNLLYAANPLIVPTSDDYIGLIATNDIIVSYPVLADRTIFGAFMALNDLGIDNIAGLDPVNLNIIGSIITHHDRLARTEINTSVPGTFNKTHILDARLRTNTPPYFPRLLNRQEIVYRSN